MFPNGSGTSFLRNLDRFPGVRGVPVVAVESDGSLLEYVRSKNQGRGIV